MSFGLGFLMSIGAGKKRPGRLILTLDCVAGRKIGHTCFMGPAKEKAA